ncbi:MAG: PAS domain S-box protein [Thermodesulfobacteriota bacterium]
MIKKRFKSVQGNVYALLAIAVICISGLVLSNIIIVRQLHKVRANVAHEHTKQELNGLLHNGLLNLRTELLALSLPLQTRDIAFHYNNAQTISRELEKILLILEQGGELKASYQVNFGNREEAVRTITYQKVASRGVDLVIIELKSHLEELQDLRIKLDELITARTMAITNDDPGKQKQAERKIKFFYKGIQPFFERIMENANRISFESSLNLEKADRLRQQVIKRYVYMISFLSLTALACLALFGTLLVKNIKRISQEREDALSDARELNEHLEQRVEERTSRLTDSYEKIKRESRERKEAQREVSKQVSFLNDTINALGHPFYVIDVDNYDILLHNTEAGRLGRAEGNQCYRLTHQREIPCDGKGHPCPVQEVVKSGKPFKVEHIHYDKDGEKIDVELHAYPIFDDAGRVVQMIEYSLDVTAKKRAERALHELNQELEARVEDRTKELGLEVQERKSAERALDESSRHFRYLIEHAPGVVMIINSAGYIEYVSPAIEQMSGYASESFVHKCLFEFTHDQDDDKLRPVLTMERGGDEEFAAELRLITRSGDWIMIDLVAANRLAEPSVKGIVLNFWDITKRKEMERSMRWLSQAVEQSPNTVIITDTDGNIEYVNASFVRTTGYAADEAMGNNPRILKSGQTEKSVYEDMWKTILAGKKWSGEFINQRKNGELYTESVIISAMRNEKGAVTHYLATKENITELKRAHEKAEEANRAKSDFLANMSHEIRTPLNGIVGFVDVLARKERDAEQRKYIDIIKSSSTHLLHIIDDILDLSKIESGKLELDLRETLIRKKLEPAIELFYAKAKEKEIGFYSFIDPALPQSLICDIVRINQVIANLINNAIKFTPDGGRVDVSVNVVNVEDDEVGLLFGVKDTGIGMDEEAQAKVFEAFSQADVSTTRKFGGTGLGLSISKQLVEKMGGLLLLTSTPGQGTTFSFELSLALAEDEKSGEEMSSWQDQVQSIGILVTDQNENQDEEHIKIYLDSMGLNASLISRSDNWDDCDLVFAVVYSIKDEVGERLYKARKRTKSILVASPLDLQEVELRYPEMQIITKPLNPSKIYDAVANVFGEQQVAFSGDDAKEKLDFRGRRVLVAEDNIVNQTLISVLLADLKIDFGIAGNGLEALEKRKEESWDLILMDVNMPEMDGLAATGEIIRYEQENGLKHIPIVSLTAHALKGDREKMLAAGMDNYLSKPVDRTKLVAIFSQYFDGDSTDSGCDKLKNG